MAIRLEPIPESLVDNAYSVEIDRVSEPEWSLLLRQFDDANVYQTWSYGAIRWGQAALSHLVLRRDSDAVAAAQLRIVRPRFARCGIAYLRWGPLFERRGKPIELDDVRAFAEALHHEYVRRRQLFLRILPNAFVGSERAQIVQEAFARHTKSRPDRRGERTLLLDLGMSLEDLRKQLDRKWRNHLNRAERNELSVTTGTAPDDWQVFSRIYRQMWARKRFDISVDVDEFGRITQDLPEQFRLLVLTCRQADEPVAGLVCSAMGHTGICLLAATSDGGMRARGSYLLQWDTVKWLKERGFRYYDLGGIDPERNPGVYSFKHGLCREDVTRIGPLEACDSVLSALCAKAADAVQSSMGRRGRRLAKSVGGALRSRHN
jgi:lipid II:glycine glycyltransferase (peptidoglycan interpeptide bridge formation enzyme)